MIKITTQSEDSRATVPAQFSSKFDGLSFAYNTSSVTQKGIPHQKLSLSEMIAIITDDTQKPSYYDWIGKTVVKGLNSGKDVKAIKNEIRFNKNNLPYFLFSGYQNVGHNNKDIEYNGCVQIDIDFKEVGGYDKAQKVKEQLSKIPYITFAGISPSTVGVKGIVLTDNTDKDIHLDVSKQILNDLSAKLNIDAAYFDNVPVSQPVFAYFDKDLYINYDADVFNYDASKVVVETKAKKTKKDYTNNFVASETDYKYAKEEIEAICKAAVEYVNSTTTDTHWGNNKTVKYAAFCNHQGINLLDAQEQMIGIDTNNNRNKRNNEIADVYTRYAHQFGMHIEAEKVKQAEYLKAKQEEAEKQNKNAYHLTATQYISDLNLKLTTDTYIVAKTGLGKTTAIAKMTDSPTVVVFPNQAGLEDYLSSNKNASAFYQRRKDVEDGDKLIATTYKSFPKVAGILTKEKYVVFFDEAHYYTIATSTNYLANTMNAALDSSLGFKNVHLISGTPIFNFDERLNNKEVLKFTKDSNSKQTAVIIYADDTIATAVATAKKCKKEGNKFSIYLNNKNEEGALGRLHAALADLNVAIINADKKHTDDYHKIIIDGDLSDFDGYISTSLTNDAFSLTNTSKTFVDIILTSEVSSIDLAQRTRRARDAQEQETYIIRKNNSKYDEEGRRIVQQPKYFNLDDTLAFERQKQADAISFASKYATGDALYRLVKLLRNETEAAIKLTDDFYVVNDDTLLSNSIYKRQTYVENRNQDFFKAQLAHYDINLLDERYEHSGTFTKEESKAIKEVVKETKEANKAEIEAVLAIIENDTVQQNKSIKNSEDNISDLERDLRTKVDIISNFIENEVKIEEEITTGFPELDMAFNFNNHITQKPTIELIGNAVEKLREIGFTTRNFNSFLRAAKGRKHYFDENIGANELKRQLENKIFELEIGKRYTSEQINEKLQSVFTKAGAGKVTKTRTTKLAADYVGLKKIRQTKRDADGNALTEFVMIRDEKTGEMVKDIDKKTKLPKIKILQEVVFEVKNHNPYNLKTIITPKIVEYDEMFNGFNV